MQSIDDARVAMQDDGIRKMIFHVVRGVLALHVTHVIYTASASTPNDILCLYVACILFLFLVSSLFFRPAFTGVAARGG